MEKLDFSEDEIQHQLEALGYNNIPRHRLREFKRGGLIKLANIGLHVDDQMLTKPEITGMFCDFHSAS